MELFDKFSITGRGTVITARLEPDEEVVKINDTIIYKGERYVVRGIEASRNLLNGKILPNIGILVKKIQ